jgi:hypothetical protein
MYEDQKRDNSGIFFVNNRKQSNTHPDFQGSIMVAGEEYWLNIWTKHGKNGEFWSCAVKAKNQQQQQQTKSVSTAGTSSMSRAVQTQAPAQAEKLDDDIPF